jgi:hypothetical protein
MEIEKVIVGSGQQKTDHCQLSIVGGALSVE